MKQEQATDHLSRVNNDAIRLARDMAAMDRVWGHDRDREEGHHVICRASWAKNAIFLVSTNAYSIRDRGLFFY